MRSLSRWVVVVPMLSLWFLGVASGQPGLTRQDRQGPVTVALTATSPLGAEVPLRSGSRWTPTRSASTTSRSKVRSRCGQPTGPMSHLWRWRRRKALVTIARRS